MKHLKTYKLFESTEDLESKIKECFSGVSDMDINMKFDGYRLPNGENIIIFKVNLDGKTTGEDSISKWGVRYNPVINGQEIAFEISNSIQHCFGEDLNIKWANVRWKNAGEWSEFGKTGSGPGMLEKVFSKTGITSQFENPEKGHYNLDDLCDFIESKGDMLRTIEIHFVE